MTKVHFRALFDQSPSIILLNILWVAQRNSIIIFNCPSIICTVVGYEVGMAESPSIATVVSAMLHCDLVSILFT